MVIGIAAYKFKDSAYPAYGTVAEFDRQIEEVRKLPNLSGCFFFRMRFLENTELYNFLKTKYAYKSLLPVMGNLTAPAVEAPTLRLKDKNLSWNAVPGAEKYAVYMLEKDNTLKNTFKAHAVQIISDNQFAGTSGKSYFVTAADKDNVESERSGVVSVQ